MDAEGGRGRLTPPACTRTLSIIGRSAGGLELGRILKMSIGLAYAALVVFYLAFIAVGLVYLVTGTG